ncbi:MAG: hypothetical protein AB8F74_12730 [Saprospiraceae bacterium]
MKIVKPIFSLLRTFFIAILLTVITQVGGVIYLALKPVNYFLTRHLQGKKKYLVKAFLYFGVYLIISLTIVPKLALKYNRVPLPRISGTYKNIKPARNFYWIANRNYVRKELFNAFTEIANNTSTSRPGTVIYYLDANFPLFDYFPLLPHKSHNDGRRLDISFLYTKGKEPINAAPGVLGYGHSEVPQKEEVDYPKRCAEKGNKIYSALYQISRIFRKDKYQFDEKANRELLRTITSQKKVRKVFIEPHLKSRLKLSNETKIRFHGCGAVRHDDHIHLEI